MVAASPPPGWYNDHADPQLLRWWDGGAWTPHTKPAAPPPPAPPSPVPPPPVPLPPPASTPTPPRPQAWPASGFAGPNDHTTVMGQDPVTGQGPSPRTAQLGGFTDLSPERPSWQNKKFLLPVAGVAVLLLLALAAAMPDPSDLATDQDVALADAGDEINPLVGDPASDPAPDGSSAEEGAADEPTAGTTALTSIPTTTTSTTIASTEATSSTTTATTAPTTAAPTTAASTTQAPTTAAPTTAAPTTQAPTTAAPTTQATTATTAAAGACHPAYVQCLPNHPGDALNCGNLSSDQKPVQVRNPAVDPYGLDADNDGIGCESG